MKEEKNKLNNSATTEVGIIKIDNLQTHADVKAKVDSKGWFYTDIVKEHFFKPQNFLDSRQAESYNADGIGMVGSPACGDMMKVWIKVNKKEDRIVEMKWQTFGSLLPGARILLSDFTTKKVEDLKMGDKIIDGTGKENFIEEVLSREYNGKIVNIKLSTSNFYNFFFTPNHPIPCVVRESVALVNRRNKKRMSEVSQEKLNHAKIELFPASKLQRGDFLIFQPQMKIKDVKELDEDLCCLLGYYVSDGSTHSKNEITFYFGLNEIEFIKEIERISKNKKWDYRIFKRNTENVTCIQINNSKLRKLLVDNGGKPSEKKFSDKVLFLPIKKQEKIINSYINGDGWILNQEEKWQPQYFISTSKEEIAYQLQIMLARTGIFAPIHKRGPREFIIRGKIYRNNGEYNLIFRKDIKYSRIKYNKKEKCFLIPISEIKIENYKGKIYDPGIVYEPKTYRVNGISIHNCASALASTSMLSVMATENGGMPIESALKIKPQDIVKRLGDLPARKFHCSVLGDKALRAAINDYFRKSGQVERMIIEGCRVIDKETGITDKDIEEAVLEGADTVQKVQHKLKVGVSNKACLPEVEQLIRFYKEKYFGAE